MQEPEAKVPKTSPEGSPSSSPSRLFAPHSAENVQHVMEVGEVDDEQREEEIAEFLEQDWVALGGDDGDGPQIDEGRPPQVSSEELTALDEAAGFEEIKRLLEMKVIEEPSQEDLEHGVVLSTRSVMDWRFRGQKWQRRCRYVEKKLILCSHVDDLVVGGEREAVEWLVAALKSKLTLQGGELIPAEDQDDQEPVRFLKKRHFFTHAGVIISPHEKYADELVQLYGLQHRKPKATPDVCLRA